MNSAPGFGFHFSENLSWPYFLFTGSKDVLVDKAIEHTRLSIDNVFVKAMKAFYEVIVRLINALAVLCIKRMGEILAGIFLKSVDSF